MKQIIFTPLARADVRRMDRANAMRILTALHRFAETGEGDVKKLKGDSGEMRLRVGDYRLRFTEEPENCLHLHFCQAPFGCLSLIESSPKSV